MKFEKKKRGEITTTQIVMIVVLIVSFIVLLYFFYRLNLGSTTNSETCHNSVVLKTTGKGVVGGLDCSTDYVCITGGGKCSGMNPTITVKVDPNNKNEIMKAIADQMSQCWWTYGEGNLQYGNIGFLAKGGCALCSEIEFDNDIQNKNYDITYQDLYSYLSQTKKDSTQTYLTYLYGTPDLPTLVKDYKVLRDNLNANVLGSDKFAVVTGYKDSFLFGWFGKKIMPVSYVPTSQVSSELGCSNFITKA